jgi:TPR repeat protein
VGRRKGGAVAVVLGALLGVAAAVARHADTPAPPAKGEVSAPESASPAAGVTPEPSATTEPSPSEPSALAPAPPLDAAVAAPNSAPSAATPSASAAPVAANIPPVLLPPLETPKELERAEVRCYRKVADECERAATAYAQGRFGPADIERAAHLREVSLTFLVKDCQRRSPHACLVLANRYSHGIGVDTNPKKARAVFEHGRELCRRKPSAECDGGEPR